LLKIIKKHSKLVLLFSFILLVGLSFTACDNGINDADSSDDFSITGRPVTVGEDGLIETYALIVLEQDGEEIDRVVNNLDESSFKIDGLQAGTYTLKIYRTDIEPINKEVVLELDTENNLGDIKLEPEQVDEDEKDATLSLIINTEKEHMDNKKVRLALAHIIDRQELMDIFVDHLHNPNERYYEARLATRYSAPSIIGYDENTDINLKQDLEKAQNYIDQAEYDEEIEIDLYYFGPGIPHYDEFKDEIINSVENIDGLTINPVPVEDQEIFDNHNQLYPIGNNFFRCPYNLINYRLDFTEEMLDKFEKAGLNLDDQEKVADIILEIEEMLIEEGKVIPIFHRASY